MKATGVESAFVSTYYYIIIGYRVKIIQCNGLVANYRQDANASAAITVSIIIVTDYVSDS